MSSTADDSDTGDAAEALARICAELLSVDRVSPDDNFFERGGDSVMGVRVAARAARAGVHFTPQQLLQHHTLRELAAASTIATVAPPSRAELPPVRQGGRPRPRPGLPIHLTPIMRMFLDRLPGVARDFTVVNMLETTARIDADTMRLAVDDLLARHEPLRYRFRRNSIGWRIDLTEPGGLDVFDTKILPPMSDEDERAAVLADVTDLRSRVDLERGPALRVRYYDRGHDRGGWLVFLVHHFVFDNMSTVVLIDDLDKALTELVAGRALPAVEPVVTWQEWSQHLQDMAGSDDLAGELAYWTGIMRSGAATQPVDPGPGGPVGMVIRTIENVPEQLRKGQEATEATEAAMTAIACGLARWRGTTAAYVFTEGTASPNTYRPPGHSPAVGWFTSLHPLLLPVEPGASARESLPAVAARIRSVPNDGVGYGILRHLSLSSPGVDQLRALPEPDAVVLHHGHDGSGFDLGVQYLRNRLDLLAEAPRPAVEGLPLVVTTNVQHDSDTLMVAVTHDSRYSDIEALADEIVRAFGELA